MSNKKTLKKNINSMVYDAVEECFSIQLYDHSKKEETDKFIDEIADFHDNIIKALNKAKSNREVKEIITKAEKAGKEWTERLNKL